jgi:hypothetical protein
MSFLQSFGVVLLILAAIGLVLWLGNKGYFNKAKVTYKGTELKFDESNWRKYASYGAGVIFLIIIALLISGCSEGDQAVVEAPSKQCPSVMVGTVDAPPMEDRVKALAIEAQSKGIQLTGDYATDVRNQGGEMMLIGTGFRFEFDDTCHVIESKSSLNLFLADYPVDGGIDGNGNLGMAVNVGGAKVGIHGQYINGKLVNGKVIKGWLPHIYGVLNETN